MTKVLTQLISTGYKKVFLLVILPLFKPFLAADCRFVPTCSEYAEEALLKHGAWKGTWLALKRIGRCHPWGARGVDLVPSRK
ncbi:MAG: membrane protein insertion efficiency factor YidD [bacterium]|nr:membrane protein insertion efficiency factor YidD [bacterium]